MPLDEHGNTTPDTPGYLGGAVCNCADCCTVRARCGSGYRPPRDQTATPPTAPQSEDDETAMTHRPTNKDGIPARRRACGNCGRLGHLTRTCRAPAKAYDKIGVEVEGWWLNLREAQRVAANWHMDGTDDGSLYEDESEETRAWEFRTRPGSLGEAISQVVAVYPDKYHNSAGMHVHMSFKDPADISCLASPEFLAFYKERWQAWGTAKNIAPRSQFWRRLNGENSQYCATNSESDLSTRYLRNGSRYRQINFTCFERHGTMEMRMLPLFRDARLAVAALEEWVAIVEDFLRDHANRYLARFDRDAAVDVPPATDNAPVTYSRGSEVQLDTYWSPRIELNYPVTRALERTVLVHPPAAVERTTEVDVAEVTPVAPGHTRVFYGAINAGARTLLNQLAQGAL